MVEQNPASKGLRNDKEKFYCQGKENKEIVTGRNLEPKKGHWLIEWLAHVKRHRKEPAVRSSLSLAR